jgi:hypothetical protein
MQISFKSFPVVSCLFFGSSIGFVSPTIENGGVVFAEDSNPIPENSHATSATLNFKNDLLSNFLIGVSPRLSGILEEFKSGSLQTVRDLLDARISEIASHRIMGNIPLNEMLNSISEKCDLALIDPNPVDSKNLINDQRPISSLFRNK